MTDTDDLAALNELLADTQGRLYQVEDDLADARLDNEQLRDACAALTRELVRVRAQRDQRTAHTEGQPT